MPNHKPLNKKSEFIRKTIKKGMDLECGSDAKYFRINNSGEICIRPSLINDVVDCIYCSLKDEGII